MIPSDPTRKMLGEPTFGPQMGAVRQRSKYAVRPIWLALLGGFLFSGAPGFFWCALSLTPPQSFFSPLSKDRRGRGRATKGSTNARGYGAKHQKLRATLARSVERGGVVYWRCGKAIVPGEAWDLGHDDHDRSRYKGPEHAGCNRATASRRVRRWQSREW